MKSLPPAACLLILGCTSSTVCDAPSGLAANAALVAVEVYPATASCEGDRIAANSGAPLQTIRYSPRSPTPIHLAPGTYVVHITSFADSQATITTGQGCSANVVISAGNAACLPVTLDPVDDGVPLDMTPPLVPPDLACPPHSNGVGQSYIDCVSPLGTYTSATAMEACLANTGSANRCKDQLCSGGGMASAVCTTTGSCICWAYSNAPKGMVYSSPNGGCSCSAGTIHTWN